MSVEKLQFSNGGLNWLTIKIIDDKVTFIEVDGKEWKLDRSQAHLLMLYLQEHLKEPKKGNYIEQDKKVWYCPKCDGVHSGPNYVCNRI